MAEENREIFVGSGASLTFVPETRLYVPLASSSSGVLSVHSDYDGLRLVDKMYIGCSGEYYDSSDNLQGKFTVTANELDSGTQKITISPSFTWAANDYIILDAYGTPCPAPRNGDYCRLNADNWLGLLESANFPSTDIEMKQLNLQLGGTRNWTHQYKGIETASGANLNLIANHGAWLYYALGKCTSIAFENGSGAALDGATITTQMGSGAVDGKFMIETASGNGTDTSTTAFVDDLMKAYGQGKFIWKRSWKDYPQNQTEFNEREQKKYQGMIQELKDDGIDIGNVTPLEAVINIRETFKRSSQPQTANSKLMQITWLYNVMSLPTRDRNGLFTDMIYLAEKAGRGYGPYGKLY